MVIFHQIVVNGFGNMHRGQIIVGGGGKFFDNTQGIRGVVAADIAKITNMACGKNFKNLLTVSQIRLIACRTKCGTWSGGDLLQMLRGLLTKVDEFFIDNTAYTEHGSIHPVDLWKTPRF